MKKHIIGILLACIQLSFLFSDDFVKLQAGTLQRHVIQRDSTSFDYEMHIDSFYMCIHEVTQNEWLTIMDENPSETKGDNLPVTMVNWYDAVLYCNKRSIKEGLPPCYTIADTKDVITYDIPLESRIVSTEEESFICNWSANGYRLPTEAEWEYAARSEGKDTTYFSGSNNIDEVAVYYEYIGMKIQEVMSKKANSLGLYDISGNVSEWCWDWYDDYDKNDIYNPKGPSKRPLSKTVKIHRGGSWSSEGWNEDVYDATKQDCCVSQRAAWIPTMKDNNLGFRVVRSHM
ncbi:MAG: formylglycine-generating enzyme family protein [Treponema sp.]|nr:formylglycine-generating enzyme family protein [Treponema sp.]